MHEPHKLEPQLYIVELKMVCLPLCNPFIGPDIVFPGEILLDSPCVLSLDSRTVIQHSAEVQSDKMERMLNNVRPQWFSLLYVNRDVFPWVFADGDTIPTR